MKQQKASIKGFTDKDIYLILRVLEYDGYLRNKEPTIAF